MKIFFITVIIAAVVDQASKYMVKSQMALHQSIAVIENFFYLTYIENTGIAFGMFGHNNDDLRRWMLVGIITAAMAVISVYWRAYRNDSLLYNLSCGLILGGAFGNYIDRVLRGSVTDFFEFGIYEYRFAIFNVADAAVSIGVVLFIIYILFISDKQEKKKKEAAPGSPVILPAEGTGSKTDEGGKDVS
ncbi:MAG: signal peptidase II [Candidatus Goldiibacteriota bacterium]